MVEFLNETYFLCDESLNESLASNCFDEPISVNLNLENGSLLGENNFIWLVHVFYLIWLVPMSCPARACVLSGSCLRLLSGSCVRLLPCPGLVRCAASARAHVYHLSVHGKEQTSDRVGPGTQRLHLQVICRLFNGAMSQNIQPLGHSFYLTH